MGHEDAQLDKLQTSNNENRTNISLLGPFYSEWAISFAGVSIYPLCSDIFGSSIQIRLIEVIAMNFKSDALAPILVNLARLRDDP